MWVGSGTICFGLGGLRGTWQVCLFYGLVLVVGWVGRLLFGGSVCH